jgi:flagellar biosynthesis protein FliR
MNLFAVGFPLAVILGFVMLWLSLPALASVFGAILDDAFDVAGSIAGGAR